MKEIPRKYKEADLRDLDPKLFEILTGISAERRSMFLFGGVGAGKTHSAYALAKHIGLENVKFLNVPHFLATLRSQFKKVNELSNDTVLDIAEYSRYVILDDIGVEKSSDWVFENIYTIINYRYEHELPTIITSNLDVGEVANKLGERIASRIYEMCELVEITGKDKRLI